MVTTTAINDNRNLNPTVPSTGNIMWAYGLNGAKNWRQYPNSVDIIMDNVNTDIFYIKAADEMGNCKTLRAFKYDEISLDDVPMQDANTLNQAPMKNFVTRDDLNDFKAEILEAIRSTHNNQKFNKQHNKPENGENK